MNDFQQKILIIRLSSIGDILLTTSFLRQTHQAFPKSQIDFVIKEEFGELLENNPYIQNLYKYNKDTGTVGLKKFKKELLKIKYDYIFDLHNNIRSIYLIHGLQSKNIYRIQKNKLIQFLYVRFKINRYAKIIPIAERYLNVGNPAGIKDDKKGLELFWNKNSEDYVNNVFGNNKLKPNDHIFAVAPGAGFYTKRWPIDYYKSLIENIIEKYRCKVVILGDENDIKHGVILGKNRNVIDLTGKLSLIQSAIVISKSKALVSNDTGLMHMATAVNTPVVAIFGSTVKEFGFFPYRSKSIVVENSDLSCRPCSHIGRKRCPEKHFKCMLEITPDTVMNNIERLNTL